jgi:hypothetical protein
MKTSLGYIMQDGGEVGGSFIAQAKSASAVRSLSFRQRLRRGAVLDIIAVTVKRLVLSALRGQSISLDYHSDR